MNTKERKEFLKERGLKIFNLGADVHGELREFQVIAKNKDEAYSNFMNYITEEKKYKSMSKYLGIYEQATMIPKTNKNVTTDNV